MSNPKMASLDKTLSNKTMAGEVTWETTEREQVFQISFAENSVRIRTEIDFQNESTDYLIGLYNARGVLMEEVSDTGLKDDIPYAYIVMKDLFEAARRQALGVEKAINDILSKLTGDDLPDPPNLPDPDLPF